MFKFIELEDIIRDLMTEEWQVVGGVVCGPAIGTDKKK